MTGKGGKHYSSSVLFARCFFAFLFLTIQWVREMPLPVEAAKNTAPVVHTHLNDTTYTEIDSAAEFAAIRNDAASLSGAYRLMTDIDLSGYSNWIPLGNDSQPFTGELDGNGKKITGLKITDTTGSGQGLFGTVSSLASIHDLTVEGASVTAGSQVGILVGINNGSIQRCGVSGSISGNENVGGLVGQNASSIIASNSTATVTGQASVGGLVGSNSGTIAQSYAASPVLASVFNNYLQFDGVDDYILIPHIASYQTSSFTLEAWFQWDDTLINDAETTEQNNADVQFIVGKGFEQFEIHTEGGSKARGIRFIPIPRISIVNESSDAYHDVLDVIQPGWFHVAASYDYINKEVRVYVNGVIQDIYHYDSFGIHQNVGPVATVNLKNPDINPFANNTFPLLIGARSPSIEGGNPAMFFKGKIADVRFWNTVRSGSEIDADKNKQLTGTETGLMGYWKLNDGSGSTVIDSSNNSNPGTLMGEATWVQESVTNVGGLVGSNTGSVGTDSFYDSEISGMSDAGKGVGKTTAAMMSQATFSDAGWNFTNTWQITEGTAYPSFIRYTLTYTAGTGGSLSGAASQTVDYGGLGTAVTAVPDSHYHFVKWSDDSTANPRTDSNVTQNVNVSAVFALDQYTLSYTAGVGGSLSGVVTQTVDYGNSGTAVTAVPDTANHYHFVKWSDDSTANPRTDSNVTQNVNVSAVFALDQYTLSYTAGVGGSLSGAASQTVDYGNSGTAVTAVPDLGYHFVKWSDGSTANPRTDLNVISPVDVSAQFEINQYNLTYTAGAGGSLSGETSQIVNHGGAGTAVTAIPNNRYHFVKWSDDVSTATRRDENLQGPLSVIALFSIDQFTLTYSAGEGGQVVGDTDQIVNSGEDGSAVTAVPSHGYRFVRWSDGSTANPRTDLAVNASVNVSAEFAQYYVLMFPLIFY